MNEKVKDFVINVIRGNVKREMFIFSRELKYYSLSLICYNNSIKLILFYL